MRYLLLITFLAILIASSFKPLSASARPEWYSKECCTKHDCRPAVKVRYNPITGNFILTDKNGLSVTVHDSAKFRMSQDGSWHFCYNKMDEKSESGPLYCIYRPGMF